MKCYAGLLAVLLLFSEIPARSQLTADATNEKILSVREAVWRAWFADDEKTLCSLVPADALAISAGEPDWKTRPGILADARAFHASGAKLIALTFGRTTVQRFGDAAFVYSEYKLETGENGVRKVSRGRATEVFVRQNGRWMNPGWHTDSQ
jgi:ketosteroid isomerase-like protein